MRHNHSQRAEARGALLLVVVVVAVFVARHTSAQVVDADGSFEAVHHDIGRITSASSPAVAGATIVRETPVLQPEQQPPQSEEPSSPHRALPAASRAAAAQLPPQRRKNTRRVTYAVKPFQQPLAATETPTLVERLPAPQFVSEQPARAARHNSHHRHQPTRVVQVAALPPPPPTAPPPPPQLLPPTVEPLPVVEQPQQQAPPQPAAFGQPAESFAAPLTLAAAPSQTAVEPARHSPRFTAPVVVSAPRLAETTINAPAALQTPNSYEEPIPEPSFESVAASGCPAVGVFSWPNKGLCDRYYMCTNGTFTEEACPNGLSYSKLGAVYQHCAYNWNVDCGLRKSPAPAPSAGCDWQFGIFAHAPNQCSINYHVCEWGLPEVRQCKDGLFYDDRIKGCQWADQLGCKSEPVLQFKCPLGDEDNQYYPFPRYYHSSSDIIVCVSDTPRLVHCNEDQFVDPNALACMDKHPKKKKLLHAAAASTNTNAVRLL